MKRDSKLSSVPHISLHPSLLAIGSRTESPGCLLEQAFSVVLLQAFDEAEEPLFARHGEAMSSTWNAEICMQIIARGGECISSGKVHE